MNISEDPVVVVNNPRNLEILWNNQPGFLINSFNLEATFKSAGDVKFFVTKYLDVSYIFNLKVEKIVSSFTQDEITNQLIAIILKETDKTSDFFRFNVSLNGSLYQQEYRMDLNWASVFLSQAEYAVCEDAGFLNIIIYRSGYLNVSSYVTVTTVEQTAKEGLDFVSRHISKIQFDPGIRELAWQIGIVKDDLEEAPIEQMLINLSNPENCVIYNLNSTLVSIYDFNRGSCSMIPFENWHHDDFKERNDNMTLSLNFPMACDQYIYGLLHFNEVDQSLYTCDGQNWVSWKNGTKLETVISNNGEAKMDYTNDFTHTTNMFASPSNNLNSCLKGWQEFNGMCYKWFKSPSNWQAAQRLCSSYMQGTLTSVESHQHNEWLMELARRRPFWIGLHFNLDDTEWAFVDLDADVNYVNWKKSYPRLHNFGTLNQCVLVRGSGFWINKNCETHEHSFICCTPSKS